MNVPLPRWQLRLETFGVAVRGLEEAVALSQDRPLSELEKAGTVQRYEIAWELGWKLLADFLSAEFAPPDYLTPGSTIRSAFAAQLIASGDDWMAAAKLRNQLSHTYSVSVRDAGLKLIETAYLPMLADLFDSMEKRRG